MARAVTNLKIPKIPTTVKSGTSNTSSNTSNTTNKPSNSTTPTNTANYNEILSKLNDYALKSALNNYITQQDLNSAISNIKQCNCESQATTPVDNNALSALIQKLNNYGIFNYDVPGKETIVTEFFPGLISKDGITYADGKIQYRPSGELPVYLIAYNVDLFDYLLIKEDNNTPINQSTYKHYFTKSADYSDYCYVSSAIVNEPIVIHADGSLNKAITLLLDGDGIVNALTAAGYSPKDPSEAQELTYMMGPKTISVEFIPTSSNEYIKNRIKCRFDGQIIGTGGTGINGTITLTMPENVTLINPIVNPPTHSISVVGNVITVDAGSGETGSYLSGTYLTKQIIIAESNTKRYVIKLNGEPVAPPPNY